MTVGLVFRAAGSGVLLVVVLVALAEALVEAEVLAGAVLVAEVRPAYGAAGRPARWNRRCCCCYRSRQDRGQRRTRHR